MSPHYTEVWISFAGAATFGFYMLILVGLLISRQKKTLQKEHKTHVLQRKEGSASQNGNEVNETAAKGRGVVGSVCVHLAQILPPLMNGVLMVMGCLIIRMFGRPGLGALGDKR